MPRASKKACNSSNDITLSMAPPVFSNRYSNFLEVHGPMKTIFAVGSERLIRRAVSTMGDTELEMYCVNSGKFFSTKETNDGQHDVVSSFFSSHSLASR